MNISTKKLKRMFKELRDRDISKVETNPYRDWSVILAAAGIFFIISVVFHARMFVGVQRDSFLESFVPETKPLLLDRKGIENVIEMYDTKAARLDTLINSRAENYTEVADPSL